MWLGRNSCLHTPPSLAAGGVSCFTGAVVALPRPDGFLTTRESAALVGVKPPTIRAWRASGLLAVQGLDERGFPLHTAEAVRAAERKARESGRARGGYDPRRLRGHEEWERGRPAQAA
jgi:hypothetical protein